MSKSGRFNQRAMTSHLLAQAPLLHELWLSSKQAQMADPGFFACLPCHIARIVWTAGPPAALGSASSQNADAQGVGDLHGAEAPGLDTFRRVALDAVLVWSTWAMKAFSSSKQLCQGHGSETQCQWGQEARMAGASPRGVTANLICTKTVAHR